MQNEHDFLLKKVWRTLQRIAYVQEQELKAARRGTGGLQYETKTCDVCGCTLMVERTCPACGSEESIEE
jgi:hypothetical protein